MTGERGKKSTRKRSSSREMEKIDEIAKKEITRDLFGKKTDLLKLREICKVQNLPIIPPSGAFTVEEYPPDVVRDRIKAVFQEIYQQLQEGRWPSFEIPLRRREYIVYDDRGNLFFGGLKQKYVMNDEYPDFLQTLSVAKIVHDLVSNGKQGTKREVFYNDAR